MDLGQCPLRVDVAGGGNHLGQLGVDLGSLDGVEGGDAVVGGGVEQMGLQLGGGADPVVLGSCLTQRVGVDRDRWQAQALQPGQGDGVALNNLEQAAQHRLAQVGVRGGTGGDGVDELLGGGAYREVEISQDGWDEDLPAAGQGPAAHPAHRNAGVRCDEPTVGVRQLRGRARRPAFRSDRGFAETGGGVPHQLLLRP